MQKPPSQDSNPAENEDNGIELIDKESDEQFGEQLCFRVGANLKFKRLDKYLGGRFSQFSRTRLQKLIKSQGVNVNGRPAKPGHKLNPGDEIDLILPPQPIRELIGEDIPLTVIHEDDDIIVINKQPGIIVHPARSHTHGTLVNALIYHVAKLSTGGDEFRPGIVHRLDRNTSGVMVVAKTDEAHWKLSRQFSSRTTKKTYIAVVHGTPELTGDCINKPLGVHPKAREKYAIRPDVGKEAVTFYEVIEEFRGFSVIKLTPKTGRTHQIRVHMNYIKHPVVADDMYGGKLVYPWQLQDAEPAAQEPIIARQALHAWKLELKHPATDELVTFEAPLPPDIQNLIDILRKYRQTE